MATTNTTNIPMPDQPLTWSEWVASFNQPQPSAVAAPATTAGLSQANLNAINQLYDPTFGRDEQIMAGAENAIAGGWGAGGFGLNQTNRLLDSERKANFVLGAQLLEPYLQRESNASLQASDQAARLNQIAAQGAQALQQLQLSEAGQTARLNSSQAAQLQQQVLEGQQAMQRLTLQEAGDTGRQNSQIQGQLANTLLSGALQAGRGGSGGTAGASVNIPSAIVGSSPSGAPIYDYRIQNQQNKFISGAGSSTVGGNASFGLGSSSIDQLLRKYGLI